MTILEMTCEENINRMERAVKNAFASTRCWHGRPNLPTPFVLRLHGILHLILTQLRSQEPQMDQARRRGLIAKYSDGYRAVAEALQRLGQDRLDARSAPSEWSAREIVHHLADAEMTGAIRLRRLLAEERPEIVAYNEEECARRLHYDRPIEASLEAFGAARRSTTALLERLADEDWRREGTHSETGRYTIETWLEVYAGHAHDHAAQILKTGGAIDA